MTYQKIVLNIVGAAKRNPMLIGKFAGIKKVIRMGIGMGFCVSGCIAAFTMLVARSSS